MEAESPAPGARQPTRPRARHTVASIFTLVSRGTAEVYDGAPQRATTERLALHVQVQHGAAAARMGTVGDADHVVLVPLPVIHDHHLGSRLGDAAHERVNFDGGRGGG